MGRLAAALPASFQRFLPRPFADSAQRPALLGWLGVGLAVRFLLMPFASSADLLAVYWRSHLIAHHGEVFGSYLVNMGAHYVHAAWLWLAQPFLPSPESVWTHPWWWSDSSALAPQIERAFVTAPEALQTLFVLKVPYLIADVAAGLLLVALLDRARPAMVRRAWAFWMLSPIGLYASYAFGRYEAMVVALVVAALWACERERPWLGAVLLGLAITVRGYPLLLVPLFALIAVQGVRRHVAWAGLALVPFALVMASNKLLAGTVGELARLKDFHTGSTFFAYSIPVDGAGEISLFFAFAFAAYGAVAGRALGWWGRGVPVADLWLWLLAFHAGMFALATFSAHYFMWFTPFVALAIARRPAWRGVLPLHLAQVLVALAIADLLGGPGTTWGLFSPVSPELAGGLPNLRELLLGSGLAERLAGVLRTGFLVLTLLLAWPALVELHDGARPAKATRRQGDGPAHEQQPDEGEQRGVQEPAAG